MGVKEFFGRVGDKIKDIYYAGEEKWYKGLDKIDEHLPVYKVIDRVDEVVPSFALALVLVFILLLLIMVGLMGALAVPGATLMLSVEDSTGKSVSNVQVDFASPINDTYYSNDFGMLDEVDAPLGSRLNLVATHGNETYEFVVNVDEETTYDTIVLPVEVLSFAATTARFVTATGALITEDITLTFSCTNPDATPPSPMTVTGGIANISKPSDCGILSVTALSLSYQVSSYNLAQSSNTVYMDEALGALSNVTVNLASEGSTVLESIPVKAYRASNPYSTDYTTYSTNGQATLDLPAGDWYIKTDASQGYASKESELFSVSEGASATVDLELVKTVLGLVKVRVVEGNFPLEDIHIALKKGTSEILSDDSDANGEVLFEVEEDGPFTVLASDDDYCPAYGEVNLGGTLEIEMEESDGTCGFTLSAAVYDNTGKPVPYAKVLIFGEDDEGIYKVGFTEKITDYNGEAKWENIPASDGEYKVFAYKSAFSGWSVARTFDGSTQNVPYEVTLEIPFGNVNVMVKDRDGQAIQFAEIQIFDSYAQDPVTGIRLVEDPTGLLSFSVRADKKVYAVVKMEGYETLTTLPKQVVPDGTINFEVVLPKPPLEIVDIEYLGIYKNDKRALSVEAGKEYEARFAITAPLAYEELGFFVMVGSKDVTKTELDKAYIKGMSVPGLHSETTGASYNAPTGYNIDSKYLNLEEAKWAQAIWDEDNFEPGRIIVGATIKIKSTAKDNAKVDLAYRAWATEGGSYERSPEDETLASARSAVELDELYAKTYTAWITIGEEALCEDTFCITSTYTDEDGFTNSFDTSFDARNNENYTLYLKVLNSSTLQEDSFYTAAVKLENKEENLDMGSYSLITPNNSQSTGNISGYETDWLDVPNFVPGTEITFSSLQIRPEKEGTGTLKLRVRDGSKLVYEKEFSLYVSGSKKFRIEYMKDGEFGEALPDIPSGKEETLTVKIFNVANGLEVNDAVVKIFDRFGTLLFEDNTSTIGIAGLTIPSSLPAEELTIKVEKIGYQTLETKFKISENVVDIDPASVSFTVNPQTQKEDTQKVTITNNTGLDLKIDDIELSGKFYGLINETQVESWFNSYEGMVIKANDYEEINLKVVSADSVDTADDLDGVFTITVTNGTYSWTQDISAKIRVGLGKDVDDPACMEISKTEWTTNTEGEAVTTSFNVTNNCTVDGTLVALQSLGTKNTVSGNSVGIFTVQSGTSNTDVSTAYYRTLLTSIGAGETIPVSLSFTPYGGVNGTTSGEIVFKALNETDSQDQEISASLTYNINIVNLEECIVIGADLIEINEDSESSFSIQNNCPDSVDITVNSELGVSKENFSIATGGSEDVTIARTEEDVPGAYNILVYGRESGSTSQILGNVKAILDPAEDKCINLSRYEFDVYDSSKSDTDGFDTATIKNHCMVQNVSVSVSGEEDLDMGKVWTSALIGGLAGFMSCNEKGSEDNVDCLGLGFLGKDKKTLTGDSTNKNIQTQTGKTSVDTLAALSAMAVTAPAYEEFEGELLTAVNSFETELDTPSTTVAKANKLKKEILETLDTQKTQIYKDKGTVRNVLSAGVSALDTGKDKFIGGLSSIITSGSNFFVGRGLSAIKQDAKEEEAVIKTQKDLMNDIDNTKTEVGNKFVNISIANDNFQSGFQSTHNAIKQKSETLRKSFNALIIKNQVPKNEEMETKYRAILDEGNIKIAEAYTKGATEFNETTKEELEATKKLLGTNKTNLAQFKSVLDERNKEIDKEETAKLDKLIAEAKADKEKHYDTLISDKQTEIEKLKDTKTKLEEQQKENKASLSKEKAKTTDKQDAKKIKKLETRINELKESIKQNGHAIDDAKNIKSELSTKKSQEITEFLATIDYPDISKASKAKKTKLKAENNIRIERIAEQSTKIGELIKKIDAFIKDDLSETEKAVAEDRAKDASTKDLDKEDKDPTEVNPTNKDAKKCAEAASKLTVLENHFSASEIKSGCNSNETEVSADISTGKCCVEFVEGTGVIIDDSGCAEAALNNIRDDSLAEGATAETKYFEDSATCPSGLYPSPAYSGSGTCCMKIIQAPTYSGSATDHSFKRVLKNFYAGKNSDIQEHRGGYQVSRIEPNYNYNYWEKTGTTEWTMKSYTHAGTFVEEVKYSITGATLTQSANFILANGLGSNDIFTTAITSGLAGAMGGNALTGALSAGLLAWLQQQDREVQYNDSGSASLLTIDSIELDSSNVGLSTGEVTYDYGDVTTPTIASETSGWTGSLSGNATGTQGSSSSYLYSSSYQTATQGLIEQQKLTFTNNGFKTDSPYEPHEAILTATGTINTYDTTYDYEKVGDKFDAENLEIAKTYDYEQKFHLLFNSWEYEDVPVQIDYASSCTVGQKTGITGPDAVPRIALEWDWSEIDLDACDEENNNYVYCDSTQFTISLLKKIDELRDFFQTTSLPDCPQAIDVAGTKTQELKQNSIDVGITRIWMEATANGAKINATVQSNNQLELSATVDFELERNDGTAVAVNCSETKTFISSIDYACDVDSDSTGEGTFNVTATLIPDLCTDCENNYTANDTITTTLILGSGVVQECDSYDTKSNNFQNVLAANNVSTSESNKIMSYVEFNTNLVKDGFSNDFKSDFDSFSMQIGNAPVSYVSEGLRELFLSDKFELDWPQSPGAWKAGKYSVNIIVTFKEDNWDWSNDNNSIESIVVELDPWGNPDPYYALYDVAFDGDLGIDNERTGYGSNYEQMTEEAFLINDSGAEATPNPSNNGVNTVEVSVIDSFYTINNLNRGNALTVSRSGDNVKLVMSPSVAVPLILNITRNNGRDAYAFYTVTSEGQPQNTGSYLMSWSGIGGGCVDFHGSSMIAWDDSFDLPASDSAVGSMGTNNAYGIAWDNAIKSGTASLYGIMFAPAGKSTIIGIAGAGDSASFESNMGSGTQITVNPSSGINNMKDVFDKVTSEEICVIDGREYFWNTEPYLESLNIESKESSCISS